MRFAADTGELAKALATAFAAAGSRNVQPVLRHVLCEADAGGLRLTGQDTEGGVRVPCPAEVGEPGVCLLPARFLDALRLYGGPVVLVAKENPISATFVKPGSGAPDVLEYAAEDVDSFPTLPDAPESPTLTTTAGELSTAIARTLFAASRDEGKYAMRGVLWDITQEASHLVATDGKRLAVADLEDMAAATVTALVPPKAMEMAARLAGGCGEDDNASVVLLKDSAFIATPAGTVYTRLVEGRFPPYLDVVPKSQPTTVTLDTASFMADVRRAALATDEESKRVMFAFCPEVVTMDAKGSTVGSSAVRHVPKSHDGPAVTIAFDPHYILDAARAFPAEVSLHLTDGQKSGVFKTDGMLYLVVPLV